MKIRQNEMAAYHVQKQITRFYASAIQVVWTLIGVMVLWTGFRVYVKDDFSYIYGMLWYMVPAFFLGLITCLQWILHKRTQNKTYQKMHLRWQREKVEIHHALKTMD